MPKSMKASILSDFSPLGNSEKVEPPEGGEISAAAIGSNQSAPSAPVDAAAPRPAAIAAPPVARIARKQGAGRKKKLLIGARYDEAQMGPVFEAVSEKVSRQLGREVTMQELVGAVLTATLVDDRGSITWIVERILEQQRAELEAAMDAAGRSL